MDKQCPCCFTGSFIHRTGAGCLIYQQDPTVESLHRALLQFQFHDHDQTAWWMLGLRLRILTCHVNLKTLKEESWMLQVPGKVGSSSQIKQGMHGQNVHADCASFSSHLAFIDLKPTKKDPTWSESADRWIIATLQWPNQSLLITRFELIFTSLISSAYAPKVLQEITAPLIIISVL